MQNICDGGCIKHSSDFSCMCDALITKGDAKKSSKKVQNVCDGGASKHDSDFSCVCDAGHTVQLNQPFAMRSATS